MLWSLNGDRGQRPLLQFFLGKAVRIPLSVFEPRDFCFLMSFRERLAFFIYLADCRRLARKNNGATGLTDRASTARTSGASTLACARRFESFPYRSRGPCGQFGPIAEETPRAVYQPREGRLQTCARGGLT